MSEQTKSRLDIESQLKLTQKERDIWVGQSSLPQIRMAREEINAKYEKGEHRIVTETNREKLPNFVDALQRKNYMDLRPFYQRRSRWNESTQSKLIESFIINVPVPPIFLYEKDFNSYEVMDGQQRITAIRDFYNNRFKLKDLDLWPELNGMYYSDLPSKVKSGVDRRSISSIVLLKGSAPDDEESMLMRQLVFERLNTGGVQLEKQEVRNCLYNSDFNDLLFDLAKNSTFRAAWKLPEYTEDEDKLDAHLPIHDINFYKKMEDVEMVLRFFALRNVNHYTKGMKGFLDIYMLKMVNTPKSELGDLKDIFLNTIDLAGSVYGELLFNSTTSQNVNGRHQPLRHFMMR